MRKVFSSLEVSETVVVRDALLREGVEASIQNQHSAGSAAVSGVRVPAEVWIARDGDLDDALRIVRATLSALKDSGSAEERWTCTRCKERNPGTFELCWNCQQPRTG